MDETAPRERFLASLERCSEQENFIASFYDRFIASSDDVKKKFRFTNFEKQEKMLLKSLRLCAGATSGDADSLKEINERAESHDRYHLNIEPNFYELWLDAAVATARDFDPKWDESVEAAWQRVLGFAVKHMVRKY